MNIEEAFNEMPKNIPEEIEAYLRTIKFRKKTFGGIDEYDAWKKIRKISILYAQKLTTQRTEAAALLKDREKQLIAQAKLNQKLLKILKENGLDYE